MRIMSPSRTSAIAPPSAASGRDVSDAQPARAAGEATVGDERHVLPQRHPLEHAGERQHLAHARAAAWSFVAHDDHRSPGDRRPSRTACVASSSLSNTRAGPRNVISCWSTAPTLITAPSTARLPNSTAQRAALGVRMGERTDARRDCGSDADARFSPSVCPVTVSASRYSAPGLSRELPENRRHAAGGVHVLHVPLPRAVPRRATPWRDGARDRRRR